MKTFLSFAVILFIGFGALSQEKAEFKFEKETIDYGKIVQNSNGVRVFEFVNVGKTPLVITRVQASCGCTVPKKPEQPILPGEKERLKFLMIPKEWVVFRSLLLSFLMQKMQGK